jgi:hypothetical protein
MKKLPDPKAILLAALLLSAVLLSGAAVADNNSPVPVPGPATRAGGLSCFPLVPARYSGHSLPSCDELCAAKGAACTAVQGLRNPEGCEAPDADGQRGPAGLSERYSDRGSREIALELLSPTGAS